MEKMEGKTESLEMVNENSRWLIIEFKTLPFTTFSFFGEGTLWKRWGVKQSLWKGWLIVEFKTLPFTTFLFLV
jgi:hypothetical protein